jgi:hypothetical protein
VPVIVGGGALMCGLAFRSPPARRRRVTLLRQWDGANGTLARTFWRALDALEYRVMQARLWGVDALYGPEPETEADRQQRCDREPWRRSGLRPAAGVVRPVAKVSRSLLPAHEFPARGAFGVDAGDLVDFNRTYREHTGPECSPSTRHGSDLGGGDLVKVDCAACHHVALLTPEVLLRAGLNPAVKVLDLKDRLRCRGCGRKGRAVV